MNDDKIFGDIISSLPNTLNFSCASISILNQAYSSYRISRHCRACV